LEKAASSLPFLRHRLLRKEAKDPSRALEAERSLPRLERLFESNVLGIFHAGPDARILAANDAFLATVGRSREELERGELSWIDLTAPGWTRGPWSS
jgi:PAS domain-containing protein